MPESVECPWCGIRIVLIDGLDVAPPPAQRRDDWKRERAFGQKGPFPFKVAGELPKERLRKSVDDAEGHALVAAALSRVRDASDVLHELSENDHASDAMVERWLGILADRVVAAQTVIACERAS